MIRSFRHKGLRELFEAGESRRVTPALQKRVAVRLSALAQAERPQDVNLPGFDFHALHGKPKRYSIHVNGPVCITFGFDRTDVVDVDLDQYH